MMTGTAMPAIAANTGMASRRRSRNSTRSSWRLASSPTTRKNRVINPSLTHVRRSAAIPVSPRWIESSVVHTVSYECHPGEFDHSRAAIAAPSITNAPPVSVLRKLRTGAARFRAQAVRPPNGVASVVTLIGRLLDQWWIAEVRVDLMRERLGGGAPGQAPLLLVGAPDQRGVVGLGRDFVAPALLLVDDSRLPAEGLGSLG